MKYILELTLAREGGAKTACLAVLLGESDGFCLTVRLRMPLARALMGLTACRRQASQVDAASKGVHWGDALQAEKGCQLRLKIEAGS